MTLSKLIKTFDNSQLEKKQFLISLEHEMQATALIALGFSFLQAVPVTKIAHTSVGFLISPLLQPSTACTTEKQVSRVWKSCAVEDDVKLLSSLMISIRANYCTYPSAAAAEADDFISVDEFTVSVELLKSVPPCLATALTSVRDSLRDLYTARQAVHNNVSYHRSKYFSLWRTFDCTDPLQDLNDETHKFHRCCKNLFMVWASCKNQTITEQ